MQFYLSPPPSSAYTSLSFIPGLQPVTQFKTIILIISLEFCYYRCFHVRCVIISVLSVWSFDSTLLISSIYLMFSFQLLTGHDFYHQTGWQPFFETVSLYLTVNCFQYAVQSLSQAELDFLFLCRVSVSRQVSTVFSPSISTLNFSFDRTVHSSPFQIYYRSKTFPSSTFFLPSIISPSDWIPHSTKN